MPRRRTTKACQTDDDLFERRLGALEEVIAKLQDAIQSKETFCSELDPMKEEILIKLQQSWEEKLNQLQCEMFETLQKEVKKYEETQQKNLQESMSAKLKSSEASVVSTIDQKLRSHECNSIPRIEDLEDHVQSFQIVASRHREELNKLDEMLESLEQAMEVADQKLRDRNLCFVGLTEEQDENIEGRIVQMSKFQLGIDDIHASDIENVYRIGRKGNDQGTRARNLIVRFTSKKMRDRVYQHRKRLPMGPDTTTNIYINDDLTPFRSKLFYDARRLAKAKKIHSTWSQYGNIMVKRTEDDQPTAVYNHEQLAEKWKESTRNEANDNNYSDEN